MTAPRIPRIKLADVLPSWLLALQADRKAPATVEQYEITIRVFIRFCEDNGVPADVGSLDRRTVSAFLAAQSSSGTAYVRQVGLKRFSRWLADEGEIDEDRLSGLTLPKVDKKHVVPLTDDQLTALFKACAGNEFRDRRDMAMARLMAETGMRAGECLGLTMADIDLHRGLVHIFKTKTKMGRTAPFGAKTAAAIDRYLRARRSLKSVAGEQLWLSEAGKPLAYAGLNRALAKRAEIAGIERFHLHLLRHTAATRWLAAGGTEGGLMAVAGWKDHKMLARYTAASAADRAAEESKRLGLGEL